MTDLAGVAPGTSDTAAEPPLCVDLDGTLVATDTLHESLLRMLRHDPATLVGIVRGAGDGRAAFKRRVAAAAPLDASALPYREDVLAFLREQKAQGRSLMLVTASDEAVGRAVADHLGCFDAVLASDGRRNLKGAAKLAALRETLGEGSFDYMGDSSADMPLWMAARKAYAVSPDPVTLRRLATKRVPERVFAGEDGGLPAIIEALRPRQWTKNLLLLVPLAAAHLVTDVGRLVGVAWGIVAFSLVASAGYVLNDLLDLAADRAHPDKCRRPFAAGRLSPGFGLMLLPVLLVLGFGLAVALLPTKFVGLLAAYLVLTCAYSLYFKRKLLIDVILLAGLYTLRVLAGGAAIDVIVSEWLLAFSMFLFLSLAFAKRYGELRLMGEQDLTEAKGRGYRVDEMDLIATLGSTSGFLSVLVFSLYINSEKVEELYRQGALLWFTCPLLLYWVMRIWFVARRGELRDDPLTFALSDRVSMVTGALVALIIVIATI